MEGYYLELGGVEKGFFNRNNYIKIDDSFEDNLQSYMDRLSNTDAYYTVYEYETEDVKNCLLYAPMYFDMDIDLEEEADFKKVVRDTLLVVSYLKEEFGIPEEVIEIYFSGSKGFHIIVSPEVLGIQPKKDLNTELKLIAVEASKMTVNGSLDKKIYDRRRLFRLPNTINGKTGLYKVPVTMHMLRTLSFDEIKEYAAEPKSMPERPTTLVPKARKKYNSIMLVERSRAASSKKKKGNGVIILPGNKKDLLPCVTKTLQEGVGKGNRNGTSVAIASSLFQSGYHREEITEMMLRWNEANDPPLPESEVITTVRSAWGFIQSGRGYGCTFFKEGDLCVGKTCPLF